MGLRLFDLPSIGWLIVEVVPEGSGEEQGLKPGDCIKMVDGVPVAECKNFTVVRGKIGSYVALRVKRGIPGAAEIATKVMEQDPQAAPLEYKSAEIQAILQASSAKQESGAEVDCEERVINLERRQMAAASTANPHPPQGSELSSKKVE